MRTAAERDAISQEFTQPAVAAPSIKRHAPWVNYCHARFMRNPTDFHRREYREALQALIGALDNGSQP